MKNCSVDCCNFRKPCRSHPPHSGVHLQKDPDFSERGPLSVPGKTYPALNYHRLWRVLWAASPEPAFSPAGCWQTAFVRLALAEPRSLGSMNMSHSFSLDFQFYDLLRYTWNKVLFTSSFILSSKEDPIHISWVSSVGSVWELCETPHPETHPLWLGWVTVIPFLPWRYTSWGTYSWILFESLLIVLVAQESFSHASKGHFDLTGGNREIKYYNFFPIKKKDISDIILLEWEDG